MNTQRLVEYDCFYCDLCRKYVYDESLGEPEVGIAPRTRVEMLPLSFRCPSCGANRDSLRPSTMLDGFTYDEPVNRRIDESDSAPSASPIGATISSP